jgi:hypothetical protein
VGTTLSSPQEGFLHLFFFDLMGALLCSEIDLKIDVCIYEGEDKGLDLGDNICCGCSKQSTPTNPFCILKSHKHCI